MIANALRGMIVGAILTVIVAPVHAYGAGCADPIVEPPEITVQGSGQVSVAPDEAFVTLDIARFDPNLGSAKRGNDAAVERLFALVRKYSIPMKDVQTRDVSMKVVRKPGSRDDDYDENFHQSRPIIGYLVSKEFVVRLTDLTRLEAFHSDLLEGGDFEVSSITTGISQSREFRDTAREMAIKAAREKAVAMAAALGQTIGKARTITENDRAYGSAMNSTYSNSLAYSGTSGAGDSDHFAPGQIKIDASVTVSFELN